MAKVTSSPAVETVNTEAMLAALLSTKAVSAGSQNLAAEFERIARANNHVVTFKQAKEVNPKSPSDVAYYFRQRLGKALTVRGKDGGTRWEVQKLQNGEWAYPEAVKAMVADLQAKVEKK